MTELRNSVSKMCIRSDLNLIYSMSKMLVTILDQCQDNKIASDTLRTVADGLLRQAGELYCEIEKYTADLYETQ